MDRTEIIFLFLGGFLCSQFFSVIGDCPRPNIDADDVEISPDKTSYDLFDTIKITCIGNATLTGISSQITCGNDNNWNRDVSLIKCLDDCSLASLDDNIRVISQNETIDDILVEHGITVDFDCDGIVSGHPSSTCSDGSWSNPFPVCILDTAPTTSSQKPSTPSTNTTTDMTSSSSRVTSQETTHVPTPTDSANTTSVPKMQTTSADLTSPTLVTDDDKATVPDDPTTQVANVTSFENATSSPSTTNLVGETDIMSTVVGGLTPNETIKVTEFKETADPGIMTTTNAVDLTYAQTTSPGLADMSTTMSTRMMTTETLKTSENQRTYQSNLTTSQSQFTEPPFSTENINDTVTPTKILVTDPGFTTTANDQRTTEIATSMSVTTVGDEKLTEYDQKTVPTTTTVDGETDYYSTTQYKEKSTVAPDTTEREMFTTMPPQTTMQTDMMTDGEFSTQTTPNIVEITDGMTTTLELRTIPTSSVGHMTTQEDTNQPTEIKSTSVHDVSSPTNYYSTVELGGKSTIGRYTTNGRDFTTVLIQTVMETELATGITTETQSKVTPPRQTEQSGMTSQQATGKTDDGEMTTLQLTNISTTGVKDMTTKENLFKTSFTTQSTERENTSGYDITSSKDYSSTMQPGEKSTTEADKTDGITSTTMRSQTMIQTDFVTDETFLTKATTETEAKMTSLQETTPLIIGTTDDGKTTKLDATTPLSITSTGIRNMTTIQDPFTSPVTTQPNTSGRNVTSPKVTYFTTTADDTTFNKRVASTLDDEVTTYLTTEVARVTTPSLVETTDVSGSTEIGASQTSATEITTKVDLKTETSVPTTEGEDLKTVVTDEPTIETEIISEEASSTTPVLRATTGTYEELTTTMKTSEKMTTISAKMTTSSEKVTTSSEKVTSSSMRVTDSDTTVTTGASETTTASSVVTDEPQDPSTAGEKTSIPITNNVTLMSSVNISTSGKLGTTSKTTTAPTTCEDISCMPPSAVKCDNSGQLPVCVCREGYFRKKSEQTCSEAESFQNSIRVVSRTNGQTIVYNRQLEDSTSDRFISLAEDICTAIDAIFENYNTSMRFYIGCQVFRFRQGSVIADFVTYFSTSSNITEEQSMQIIQLSLEANDALPSSNLVIDPESIISQPTNECDLGLDDCDYWNAICIDEGAGGFTCQCKDGYRDDSPESLPGRTCTEVSVNAALPVSILLIIFLVILVLVLVVILLKLRRLKIEKGRIYRSRVHVDSEIALYALGEIIPESGE